MTHLTGAHHLRLFSGPNQVTFNPITHLRSPCGLFNAKGSRWSNRSSANWPPTAWNSPFSWPVRTPAPSGGGAFYAVRLLSTARCFLFPVLSSLYYYYYYYYYYYFKNFNSVSSNCDFLNAYYWTRLQLGVFSSQVMMTSPVTSSAHRAESNSFGGDSTCCVVVAHRSQPTLIEY